MNIGSELKKQSSITEKQYQGLNEFFESDKKEELVAIKKEESTVTDKLKLVYYRQCSISDCKNIGKCYDLSFMTKYDKLSLFYHQLIEFRSMVPQTEET